VGRRAGILQSLSSGWASYLFGFVEITQDLVHRLVDGKRPSPRGFEEALETFERIIIEVIGVQRRIKG